MNRPKLNEKKKTDLLLLQVIYAGMNTNWVVKYESLMPSSDIPGGYEYIIIIHIFNI